MNTQPLPVDPLHPLGAPDPTSVPVANILPTGHPSIEAPDVRVMRFWKPLCLRMPIAVLIRPGVAGEEAAVRFVRTAPAMPLDLEHMTVGNHPSDFGAEGKLVYTPSRNVEAAGTDELAQHAAFDAIKVVLPALSADADALKRRRFQMALQALMDSTLMVSRCDGWIHHIGTMDTFALESFMALELELAGARETVGPAHLRWASQPRQAKPIECLLAGAEDTNQNGVVAGRNFCFFLHFGEPKYPDKSTPVAVVDEGYVGLRGILQTQKADVECPNLEVFAGTLTLLGRLLGYASRPAVSMSQYASVPAYPLGVGQGFYAPIQPAMMGGAVQ